MSRSRSRGRQLVRSRSGSAYRTPQSNKIKRVKRGMSVSSAASSAIDALVSLADIASSSSPVEAGVKTVVHGARIASKVAKASQNGGSRITKYGVGRFAGFSRTRRLNKRVKVKGKYTAFGIAKDGITLNFEKRTTKQANEAIVVGHTSMPGKVCAINLWRALVKRMMIALNVQVVDYGIRLQNIGFIAGDLFVINRYIGGQINTTTSDTFTVTANMTIDGLAYLMAIFYDDDTQLSDDRLDTFVFSPLSTSRYTGIVLNLVGMKVSVHTKSVLKVQNTTSEVSTDNEADDINAVPLTGKSYLCKGNNFVKKQNNQLLNGAFTQFNEECLFASYDKQNPTIAGSTDLGFYDAVVPGRNTESTFFKPAEPPKFWEIQNCRRSGKISLSPGGIKTSVITSSYTMTVQSYFSLLYGMNNTNNNFLVYNEKQGFSKYMYFEKAIGKAATAQNSITLWMDLDFKQSVKVHGQAPRYTAPIQYQQDI